MRIDVRPERRLGPGLPERHRRRLAGRDRGPRAGGSGARPGPGPRRPRASSTSASRPTRWPRCSRPPIRRGGPRA